MVDGKKLRVLMLMVMIMAALSFSACGSGSKSSAPAPSGANQWTWANGADVINQPGTYGTQGMAASNNIPGARQNAVRWVDKAGNLWLFGGYGYGSNGDPNVLNDLWEYSGNWAWMSGSNGGAQPGIYGTQGTAALSNVPGARWGAVSWTDAAGNLWLFGGYGYGSSVSGAGVLNDLWEYSPGNAVSAGQWTWMGGSNVVSQPGTYGTQGTAASGNLPGARYGAAGWTDAAGNFWLFGGNGCASSATTSCTSADSGSLNDLWKYSAGEWTWMSGSNVASQEGIYGTQGTAAAGNVPGARNGAVSWTDASGNFWLWGGVGYDSAGASGNLNDLWEYSAGAWTWMGGSNVNGQSGTYGTQGTPAAGNVPGARTGAVSWTDASGNFWLFGGDGYDSTGIAVGWLNDLWEYSAGQWTWVGGSNVNGQLGTYGTEGTAALSNVPGARTLGVSWTDASGNLWLFGGIGYGSFGANGSLNDFWQYKP